MPELVGVIPPEYLSREKKDDFLLWLVRLPIDIWSKKFILMDWCRIVGIPLSRELVEYVSGGRERDIWG